MTTKRILIVEDNEDLAFGLRRSLESERYDVVVAVDGPRGVDEARQRHFDLMILDLMLPEMDGFRVLTALRENGIEAPVLILSAKGEEADKVYGFRVGADDYVTKPFSLSELLARVAALLRRAPAREAALPATYRFGDVEVNVLARSVSKAGASVGLTPKELDLLIAFVQRPGVVLSRVDLLREVWGHAPDIMTRTVDIHVGELRRKLELTPSEPRHFVTLWKAGYRFDPGA